MVRHKPHKIGTSKSPFVLAGFAGKHPVYQLPVGISVDLGVEQQPPAFGAARIGGWSVLAARILDGFVKRLRNRMPAGIPKHETRMSITDAGKIGRLKRLSDLVTRQDRDLLAVFLADILPMKRYCAELAGLWLSQVGRLERSRRYRLLPYRNQGQGCLRSIVSGPRNVA